MLVITESKLLQLVQEKNWRETEEVLLDKFGQRELQKIPANKIGTVEERNAEVEFITETFYQQYDRKMRPQVLDQLANFIMLDYMKSVNKKKSDENQFHTFDQDRRRKRKEHSFELDKVNYFHAKRVYNLPQKRATKHFDDSGQRWEDAGL